MYVQQDNEAERLADPSDRATQEEHIHVSDAVAEHRRLAAQVVPPAIEEDPETGKEIMTGECACGCGREVHPQRPALGYGLAIECATRRERR